MTWQFFRRSEFECKCGCKQNQTNARLISLLDEGRLICNFPFVISSGYRCPAHNNRVSSTGYDGPHTRGVAVDIQVMGQNAHKLLEWALRTGKFTGIGINQNGPHEKRFIHLDMLKGDETFRPTVWSY